MAFNAKRNLLNPKFEGYKLDLISQEDSVVRYDLKYLPTQATVSGQSPLAFQEVQSRITHNHIAAANEGGRAVYVDAEFNVVLIELNKETLITSFRVVYELPKSFQSPSVESLHREYPSASFVNLHVILVSDGWGTMYVLKATETGPFHCLSIHQLSDSVPFRLHSTFEESSTVTVAILSSRHYANPSTTTGQATVRKKSPITFDIWAVKFELLMMASTQVRDLLILWHRRGDAVPFYTSYDSVRSLYILVGGSVYRDVETPPPPSYDPSADELAPIPRQGENLDAQASTDPVRPPLYSWTQSSDSVTVAFPLPTTTSKADINVLFSPQALTLHIKNSDSSSISIPHYSTKALWDRISPSASFWTWDSEGDHQFGLLTLYLDKQHEGTKWMQVFASSGASAASETNPEDVEVPETLDPSELWHIRESIEKYTSALRDGEDASGLGLGRGVPSLAEGELDEEVDANVGRSAYLTWVGSDGSAPSWANKNQEIPLQVLSTPFPGANQSRPTLILKQNIDGTVFELAESLPSNPATWVHTSTFSALAFVLASKQDTRFTYHIPDRAVFAFESGNHNRGGNVYIYRAAPTNEKWAKQAVLKVGQKGSLLGVGVVDMAGSVLLCLTDTELVLIKNI